MTERVNERAGEQGAGIRVTGVATVAVPVTDHDRALAFYVGTCGFEVTMDGSFGPGQRWVEVALPSGGTTIALVSAGEGAPAGVDTGIRLATEDAAADHAYLRERGVDVDPEVLRWPGVPPMFGLRDPDGNHLYVVERA
ncbi:Glyoxalase/Bleomycin resistance protein/Dioxygenase superfamily protein [Actinopolymorpha cephalotaxi]|uniref:Catechol 2,3-dioxygenase-like lactoylglutathione lyase family enzyme n=1 Tax=Actinopolymorpha cephalotaxi TaxID=504797 RepID=A0A1I2XWV2_9ACTN|nr:VOC family protein [Actinopolymorpha cephalotaxi]NYH87198.1 catechol 2,3-dioxygenase-like lactoylglutathione lyase family enzyme [Actinopolymorpha cephalotaxi]SFH17196.1 Glyoxalase/Bleomycin resistance protein/Dioxygenase superfamily protein [Actinopolymorpha cephalotaxi]